MDLKFEVNSRHNEAWWSKPNDLRGRRCAKPARPRVSLAYEKYSVKLWPLCVVFASKFYPGFYSILFRKYHNKKDILTIRWYTFSNMNRYDKNIDENDVSGRCKQMPMGKTWRLPMLSAARV